MFTSSNPPKPSSSDNDDEEIERSDEEDNDNDNDNNVGYIRRYFWAPDVRDIRHWDKFEWIFSFSSLFQFLGFLSYDFILLRALSLISASGLMVAHTGRRFFVGWFWAFSFAIANIIALYYMLREKYSHDLRGLNQEESFIYHNFFKPFSITALEYKQIIKYGNFITLQRGETLTVCGLISDKVFLLLSGQCLVLNHKNHTVGIISGGHKKSFVGEIGKLLIISIYHDMCIIYNIYSTNR